MCVAQYSLELLKKALEEAGLGAEALAQAMSCACGNDCAAPTEASIRAALPGSDLVDGILLAARLPTDNGGTSVDVNAGG